MGACDPYCLTRPDPDTGPDGGTDCAPMPLHALCDYRTVPIGMATSIPGLMGDGEGCFCGETWSCSASIRSPGVLDLSASVCAGEFLCEACSPHLEGECELPPLTAGDWQVFVNGEFSFQVIAEDESDPFPRPDRCQRAANPHACGPDMPAPQVPTSFCHLSNPEPGRAAIRVLHECSPCGAPAGPCEVDVLDGVITIRSSSLLADCGLDCPAMCIPREDDCLTPSLEPGTYRIVFEGADFESTFTVGSGEFEEICGP